jgi:hypothetical protein
MNDEVHVSGGSGMYSKTNLLICDTINKIIDFEYFSGEAKENGLNNLDRNEFFRITEPSEGFLSYGKIDLSEIEFNEADSIFDIKQCKSLIVMFRTSQNRSVDREWMNQISAHFPYQRIIWSESLSDNKRNYAEIIASGIPIPAYFTEMKESINKAAKLKSKIESDKKKNKAKLKKISGTKSTAKKLFNM